MAAISDSTVDALMSHAVVLNNYTKKTQQDVRKFLYEVERDLVVSLQGGDDLFTVVGGGITKKQKLDKLLNEVRYTIKSNYAKAKRYVDSELTALSFFDTAAVANAVNTSVGYNLLSTGYSKELLQSLASDVVINGAPSKEWWLRQEGSLLKRFKDQVRLGIAQGESLSDIVSRVRGKPTGRRFGYKLKDGQQRFKVEFTGGIMDVSTRDANALVRTSIQAVTQDARMLLYESNQDVLNGLQLHSTLDGRTTEFCRVRKGLVWLLKDGVYVPRGHSYRFPNNPPWHWNCRSTLLPVVKSFAEIVDSVSKTKKKKIINSSTKDKLDGRPAKLTSFEDWFADRSIYSQISLIGEKNRSNWINGKVSLMTAFDNTPAIVPDAVLAQIKALKVAIKKSDLYTVSQVMQSSQFKKAEVSTLAGTVYRNEASRLPSTFKRIHNPDKPDESLTVDQLAAIKSWTTKSRNIRYAYTNNAIGGLDKNDLKHVSNLNVVFKEVEGNITTPKSGYIYRGMKNVLIHDVGDIFVEARPSSWSLSKRKSSAFASFANTENKAILYRLHVGTDKRVKKYGYQIDKISEYPNELEVLMRPSVKYKVVGVSKDKDSFYYFTIVDLEIVK